MHTFSMLVLILGVLGGPAWAFPDDSQSEKSAQSGKADLLTETFDIIETVVGQHIRPVTRQQLVLAGLVGAHRRYGEVADSNLGQELSAITEHDALLAICETQLEELAKTSGDSLAKVLEAFQAATMQAIPGGGQLIAAKEAAVEESLALNRYVGVGIQLSMAGASEKQMPVASKVLRGGPGFTAGMMNGDLILAIDGQTTEKLSLAKVVERLRGPEGTPVKLRLQQPDEEPRDMEIVRGVTFIPTVTGSQELEDGSFRFLLTETGEQDVAYLRVQRVGPSTVHELKKAAAALRDEHFVGLILDLRQGGGRLHDAVLVADQFVDQCTLGHVHYRDRIEELKATNGELFPGVPLCVLISNESGDDRLLIAEAIAQQARGQVIGSTQRPEAFVRSRVELPNGDQLQLPTGYLQVRAAKAQASAAIVLADALPRSGANLRIVPREGNHFGKTLPANPIQAAVSYLQRKAAKRNRDSQPNAGGAQ